MSYSDEAIGTGINFASHIPGWVESLTVLTVCFLGHILSVNVLKTVFLINQMFGDRNYIKGRINI